MTFHRFKQPRPIWHYYDGFLGEKAFDRTRELHNLTTILHSCVHNVTWALPHYTPWFSWISWRRTNPTIYRFREELDYQNAWNLTRKYASVLATTISHSSLYSWVSSVTRANPRCRTAASHPHSSSQEWAVQSQFPTISPETDAGFGTMLRAYETRETIRRNMWQKRFHFYISFCASSYMLIVRNTRPSFTLHFFLRS